MNSDITVAAAKKARARMLLKKKTMTMKRSQADSLMEELDKELDRRGYTNSPNRKAKPKPVKPTYNPQHVS